MLVVQFYQHADPLIGMPFRLTCDGRAIESPKVGRGCSAQDEAGMGRCVGNAYGLFFACGLSDEPFQNRIIGA